MLLEKEFQRFLSNKHAQMVSPIVAPLYPRGYDFNKLDSALYQETTKSIQFFLEERFLRRFKKKNSTKTLLQMIFLLWSHFQCIFTVLLLIISPWTGMFPFIGTI
jgi:hypothetical protein